ncbi:hypothetical protein K431DRAFT_319234 [Polychaeton citri CBS 116435]|uniref:Hydroxyneurosporene synthase n=1 Tax=Polychaeton citri CBS 116435 TaxID=1314669 RepID=A0A9P4QBY9_9PEZI|nr:hypothetical protein K431DRAFT_319234 [Polychaeton citri CBS 116435]
MHSKLSLVFLVWVACFSWAAPRAYAYNCQGRNDKHTAYRISGTIHDEPSTAEFGYRGNGLDAPKVSPINGTVFDWWYFDAATSSLSSSDLSSAAIVFYTASPVGFPRLINETTILQATLSGTWANGTAFGWEDYPTQVEVEGGRFDSNGKWGNVGGWQSREGSRKWKVQYGKYGDDIYGSMTFNAIAPPHLPCGFPNPGDTEAIMPHVGWANVIPAADAHVVVQINGERMEFDGFGYHDKNWGDQPFLNSVRSWYWGHGTLGPYQIVFFDALDPSYPGSASEHFSAYVARDGKIVSASCGTESAIVRPVGGDDTYPPTVTSEIPAGYSITFTDVEGKTMWINATNLATSYDGAPIYARFLGTLQGGFVGDEQVLSGVAQYEQFKMSL